MATPNQTMTAGARQAVSVVSNNFDTLNELTVTSTIDTNANATNLLIFPGPCPGKISTANQQDGTHVVITSSVSTTYAEYVAYLANISMHISYIRIQTDNTQNFSGNLYMGELPPNGNVNPAKRPLSVYRTSNGGGYDDTILIQDKLFVNTKNFFLYLDKQIKAASGTSYITFSFGFSQLGNTATVQSA